MNLKLILACDKEFNIGKDGHMLFWIDEDLQRFKRLTTGNIVIMGRKTYWSIPKRPLANRINIVYTRSKIDGVYTVSSIESLEKLLHQLNPNHEKDTYLIGGAQLVNYLKDYISECFITQVKNTYVADRNVKDLFTGDMFRIASTEQHKNFKYIHYVRNREL